ncbi:MAG: 30S ribosomal protein S16 [Firmicutes bacterium ADurb.Bin080]|jgi:small subunit ribosomal protein S16|nr:30S ribosomal protein S16 [Clostridiales bacterium]OQC12683.1 MAG: 30S ribosomal protein S16 [Firmicutes bacterium ADurb.Bin080]
MAVKLRLTRIGAKKKPFYRIVAIDSGKARDSKYIEQIGTFDPISDPVAIRIDAEKAKKWLATGAQPTDTVRSIFIKEGIIVPSVVAKKADDSKNEAIDAAAKKI